jgi:hypothetical protein
MAYQRGSLLKLHRKAGDIWVLRYRENKDGKRVQNDLPVCLVCDFPKEKDAWREVDRLGLLLRINAEHLDSRIRFRVLAEHYLTHDVGPDAIRPNSSARPSIPTKSSTHILSPNGGTASRTILRPSTYSTGSNLFTPTKAWPGRPFQSSVARCCGSIASVPFTSS